MKRAILFLGCMLVVCCLFASRSSAALVDKIINGQPLTVEEENYYRANRATVNEIIARRKSGQEKEPAPVESNKGSRRDPNPGEEGRTFMDFISGYLWLLWIIPVLILIFSYRLVLRILGVVIVPDDSIGLVTKKFVIFGSNRELPPGKIIALRGEAGIQAGTVAPGLHFWLWPWQYKVDIVEFFVIPAGKIGIVESCDGKPMPDGRILACHVQCDNFQDASAFLQGNGERGVQTDVIPPGTWRINTLVFTVHLADMAVIPQGKIGIVEALDGKPLSGGRIIGRHVECDAFQDAHAFMTNGGERGPQMTVIPQGQYRINPILFKVEFVDVTDIPDNMVGIVTTKEGQPLKGGEIAGNPVEGHNMFQNPQAFVEKGGFKGLQEQVLLAGRYFINPRFATVEVVEMTKVPIANVGVVIAYVGEKGVDVTGETFKHGNLVQQGHKGVWVEPLDPGKFPINPYTHKVELVPTANVVLNWATGKTESHKLDERLSTIKVRSSDGFEFNLDVSQIIHIPRNDAPKVIARFGTVANLVTQVLEPTIGNYFRNAAQKSDVIEFLKSRSERQQEAKNAIADALKEYNVGAVDTLIGDIVPPEALMKTLTDRKIAEQERVTFKTQQEAQVVRKELEQATAMAATQAKVVDAERKVAIAEFDAKSIVKKAEGEALSKTINAEADATVLRNVGAATAEKTKLVGTAEADVIQLKTEAMDQEKYALVEMARAFSTSGFKLVPDVVAGGGGGADGGSSIVNILMAGLLQESLAKKTTEASSRPAEVRPAEDP